MKPNIQKVFAVFRSSYKSIPLEVFKDPYKILISTIMSSRTRDETTLKAAKRLFKKAASLEKLCQLSEPEIQKLIYPVGFYKTKAKNLKALSNMILKKYRGKVPRNREGLTALPGVGRKTANLVLNRAFGIPAIAVDTHVHKISNLLEWVKTKLPGETEKELTKIIPKKYWRETNRLFVSIGRQYYSQKKLLGFLKKNGLV